MARAKFTVSKAEPSRFGAMGSFGDAAGMYICQYNFPYTYSVKDKMTGADHDRCFQWDYAHARATCDKYLRTGEMAIERWVQQTDPKTVIEFIREMLKADSLTEWTGFRVRGTVNRSNGYPVYTLELFAKHPDTATEVYSGENAPNVEFLDSSHLIDIDDCSWEPKRFDKE